MTNHRSEAEPFHVIAVAGSLGKASSVRAALGVLVEELRRRGCLVEVVDFAEKPIDLFNPETAYATEGYRELKPKVDRADAFVLATPDYHGSMSAVTKNFLDHFWREFGGKLFASIVGGYDKGLTVADQIRTVARQCYAWSMPYNVSFSDREDLIEKTTPTEAFRAKLEMLARDIEVYGRLLAEQRRRDLAGVGPGFLAKWRP